MILPVGIISEDVAKQIKLDLWAGHMTQTDIAEKYNVTQPTISRIFRGTAWGGLPWPDGSVGHISPERRAIIHASRHRNTRYQHDPRARDTELDAKEAADIDAVVDSILSAQDSDLRNVIERKAGETRRRPTPKGSGKVRKFKGDLLPYPDIRESDPGHPIVQTLERDDDAPLKVALRAVCAKVPQEDWQKPAVLQMVHDEAAKIREKIT